MTGPDPAWSNPGPATRRLWEALRDQPPACNGSDPLIWFPGTARGPSRAIEVENTRQALRLCAVCPHKSPCLTAAIEEGDAHAIRGGTLPAHRHGRRRP